SYQQFDIQDYFNIPENGKKFFDILIKNVELQGSESKKSEDIGIQFREEIHNGQISFVPFIQERGELGDRFGHKTYDFQVAKDREFVFNSDFGKLLKI
ncbi:MAG: hypothetical protein KJN96_00965, partial [Eudoraea sp.]|nr:hypothetical protein [Eudoraea sp.]